MLELQVHQEKRVSRRIAHVAGFRRGPISGLIRPDFLGERVKPFVFLDYFEIHPESLPGFRPHPHSGIATHTTFLGGGMEYGDSTGKKGSIFGGSIEWMQSGAGVWHWGKPNPGTASRGYQLWIALPPELELLPARSQFIKSALIETDGTARILLGRYGDLHSPIQADLPITYLHVRLKDGESWTYAPDRQHEVAWLAVNEGTLQVAGATLERELAIFEDGNSPIEVQAVGDTELVIGSAIKHRFRLVCGPSSVHTSEEALRQGLATIGALAQTSGPA